MFLYIFFALSIISAMQVNAGIAVSTEVEGAKKVALIFGVSGQDGTYLTQLLLSKNYEVHGVSRKSAQLKNIAGNSRSFIQHEGDISNFETVVKLIQAILPNEIYNLAAQSGVGISFHSPLETARINGLGTLHILESIKFLGLEKEVKFFQAASSELFGQINNSPQDEKTPFHPCSPYGVTKLYSYWITINYREAYGIFGCNGILFNHESPIRPESFITRKITLAACRYKLGLGQVLYLGNLDAKRDWGYAQDYVEAMWLMLQQEKPDDYVIATGETHCVREFVEAAYKEVGVEIDWQGSGSAEYGIDKSSGEIIVQVDPQFYRPCEVSAVLANPAKAQKILNWKAKTSFQELVRLMIASDDKALRGISAPIKNDGGFIP